MMNGLDDATALPLLTIVSRLLLAALLGAAIGFEREWRERPAGLRTHILVCLASAAIAILTLEIVEMPAFADEAVRLDPIRLVEAVTAGVAFLAAGLIVFNKGEVHGLTTGAGIWLVGAIGLACGLGVWPLALIATVLGLVVLYALQKLEIHLIPGNGNDNGNATKSAAPSTRKPRGKGGAGNGAN